MKKLRYIFFIVALAAGLASCEKDNYDGPTAGLSGRFVDVKTQELIEQDIILGTTIEIIEHGYASRTPQALIVKTDGTYANSMLFANTYTVTPVRGNFLPVDSQVVNISGQTTLDFSVTPYIRVNDVSILKTGTKVVATFKLEQNVTNNVKKIGLYAHSDARVGEPMRLVASEIQLNAVSDPSQVYTLEIDLAANSSILKPGNKYYFRVGALIDAGEAKPNYRPAVRLDI
ncbi:Protein of unknown function [Chitinophaga ginsengisegetis]|uniref:DUF3823 domain-containing protein n=1 Tax=Chitinophaga ginsengisegetis TaxID=393003 RepID=A0A1T5PBK9_9BACT|nr:DUF3823 domain-containing protein [Chitinophaga ginsengisegetis]MDR6569403.1 hypothetical protein [Chitinophaga ginsengisegetis]MDR6648566.1 hypothetical protein [Chitinophaga ginsengisegetis]MDR6655486.1 hypothetical protein [Chitinophaga ginsengisegetis]SKD10066.1 Protein of unknown function [Chitinophaga ginsengisegetis]